MAYGQSRHTRVQQHHRSPGVNYACRALRKDGSVVAVCHTLITTASSPSRLKARATPLSSPHHTQRPSRPFAIDIRLVPVPPPSPPQRGLSIITAVARLDWIFLASSPMRPSTTKSCPKPYRTPMPWPGTNTLTTKDSPDYHHPPSVAVSPPQFLNAPQLNRKV